MSESKENNSEPKSKKPRKRHKVAPEGVTKFQAFSAVTINRDEINNAPYNPRKISASAKRKLKKAIEDPKLGLLNTPVWNKRTGNLVGGHKRIEQLDSLEGNNEYKITVAMVDMDEQMEKVANIALNNPQMQGEYDIVQLEELMADIHESDINFERTGFGPDDVQMMFSDEFVATIFGGEQEEQFSDQDADIDMLNQMFEEGADERKAEREERKLKQQIEEEAEAELQAEIDAVEESESGGLTEEQKEELKIQKLKELRQKYKDQANSGDNSADKVLTLAFGGPHQVDAFLRHFEFPMDAKVVDGYMVLEKIGIEYQEHV